VGMGQGVVRPFCDSAMGLSKLEKRGRKSAPFLVLELG